MSYKTSFKDGRLGIGLDVNVNDGAPKYPLDINGDIRLTGAILKGDGTTYTSGSGMGTPGIVSNQTNGVFRIGVNNINPTAALDISGDVIPSLTGTFDLGSVDRRWKDVFITENSFWIGDRHKMSISSTGRMRFRKRKKHTLPKKIRNMAQFANAGTTADAHAKTVSIRGQTFTDINNMTMADVVTYVRENVTGMEKAAVSDIYEDDDEDYEDDNDIEGDMKITGDLQLNGTLKDSAGNPRIFSNWTIASNTTDLYRPSGNVGIGTTTPSAYLHVRSTNNVSNYAVPQLLITTDPGSNYNQWASLELRGSYIGNTVPYGVGIRTTYGHDSNYRTYGDFSIYTSDRNNGNARTDRLTVTSTGNVGIGREPFYKLDVNGSIRVQGIYIPDYIYHESDLNNNTYMGFNGEDKWRVVTGGSERILADNSYIYLQNSVKRGSYWIWDHNQLYMQSGQSAHFNWNASGYTYVGNTNQIHIGHSNRLVVNSTGVGIGVSPGYKLDVNGDMRVGSTTYYYSNTNTRKYMDGSNQYWMIGGGWRMALNNSSELSVGSTTKLHGAKISLHVANVGTAIATPDVSHWMYQFASNWGMYWATNSNRKDYKLGSSGNPNEVQFYGNNALKWSCQLDYGHTWQKGYQRIENGNSSYTRYGPNSSWSKYLYVGSGPHFDSGQACIFNTTTNLHIEPGNGGVLYLGHYNDDETRIGSSYYSSFYGDGARVCLQGTVDGGSSRGLFYWHTNDPAWGSYMVNDGQSLDGSGKSTSSPGGYSGWRVVMRCGDDSNGCFLWENHNEDQLMSVSADNGECHAQWGFHAGTSNATGWCRWNAWGGVHNYGNPGAGSWLLIRGEKGQLPGYGNSWYMVHKTDNSTMYFSAGNAYSGYIGSNGAYHMNNYWTEHFTGQHRPLPYDEEMLKNLDDYIGLIVSATNDICSLIQDPKDGVYKMTSGLKGIQVNEAIPKVILTTEYKDKKCYGIVSGGEDENNFNSDTRATTNKNEKHYNYGSFTSIMICEEEDNRLFVNSVGEGGIWVSDEFGPIESGDYITTSGVLHGYGVLQDDDILHNYTVAKATIDCDFTISYSGMKKKVREKRGCFIEEEIVERKTELVNCKPTDEYKCYHIAKAICHGEEGCNGEILAEDQTSSNTKIKAAFKCKCSHNSCYTKKSGWCLNEKGLICDISYCITKGEGEHCEIDGICESDISGNCQELVNNNDLPHICCGVPVYKKEAVLQSYDASGNIKMCWSDNALCFDSSGELIYEECCNCCGKYGWRCTCDDGYGCDKEDMSEYSCCVKDCCYEPDYDENAAYKCREIIKDGKTYRIAFIACTYHCG